MFSALAEHIGNFDQKLNLFVALAPAIYIWDDKSALAKKVNEFLDPREL